MVHGIGPSKGTFGRTTFFGKALPVFIVGVFLLIVGIVTVQFLNPKMAGQIGAAVVRSRDEACTQGCKDSQFPQQCYQGCMFQAGVQQHIFR